MKKQGNDKKIKSVIVYGVIFTCLIITASLVVSKLATGKSSVFGYKPFFIMSASMEPTIMTHEIVLAKTVKAEEVKVGDIIAYKTPTKTIIHRVVAINNDGTFEFKGDNNNSQIPSDIRVSAEQIEYKILLSK